jgi:type I restriction enzyme S subunit
MGEVATVPLSDLCETNRRITYGIVQPGKLHHAGIPIVRVNNFRGHRLDLSERLHVAPEIEANYKRSRPKPGDLLISLVGSIGQVAIAPPEITGWNIARAVGLVPVKDRKHAEWAYYALQTPEAQSYIHRHANTTVQATFNLKDLARLPLPYPGKREREQALSVLGSLDEKIALNRRMNETLEAMAQAIFRDWFVDFGPTRRKMEGATDPVAILGGLILDPERAATCAPLFSAALAGNALPEGWDDATLAEVSYLNPESWSAPNHPDQVEYVDLANTKWGIIEETSNYNWNTAPSRARRVVRLGDTIIGTVRPGNGSYSYIGKDGLTVSTGFAVLRPKRVAWRAVVYCAATRSENIARLASLADGGAYPAVRPDLVQQSPLNMPGEEILAQFGEVLSSSFALIEHSKTENSILAATRDLLLPKLMSGEIHLRDAEV